MTAPTSQITINDGTTTVNVDGYATLGLTQGFERIDGGSAVTRFLDGSAIKQTSWAGPKWRITLRGRGWVPSGLWDLDYTVQQTWTIADPAGPVQYVVFADRPTEEWDINAAQYNWELIGVEK